MTTARGIPGLLSCASPTSPPSLCAHWVQSEVCNGGFQQFFLNSTGVLARRPSQDLKPQECPDSPALSDRQWPPFGPTYPRDREVRIAALEADSLRPPLSFPVSQSLTTPSTGCSSLRMQAGTRRPLFRQQCWLSSALDHAGAADLLQPGLARPPLLQGVLSSSRATLVMRALGGSV
ncbi:MAG: DUF4375 domain-containing protein [Gemmatimonadetes bacterium]|nr:DUF4375 domain-containing protein [Gemmatimonadota bacterium]